MAEENDPVMAEVMNMLEVEPSNSPAETPGLIFHLSVSSLRFWFLQASAKKQLAWIWQTIRWSGWKTKTSWGITKGTRPTLVPRLQKPWLKAFCRCQRKHLACLCNSKMLALCKMSWKRLHNHKGAVRTVWWACAEMWSASRRGKHASDHSKTCRFQRRWRDTPPPFLWCRWLPTCWGRWSTNC